MRVVRTRSAFFWALWACLLAYGLAGSSSTTSSSSSASTTPAPTSTPAPGATPSPGTPSPSTTPSPGTPSPTPSPESSSSGTSRATVVAWALFTVAACVALLILLYKREKSNRRRIHHHDSLRQSLAPSDALQPEYDETLPPPGHDRDPTMSSF